MIVRCLAIRIMVLLSLILCTLRVAAQPLLPEIAVIYQDGKAIVSWNCQYDNVKSIKIQRSADSLRDFYTIGFVENIRKGPQVYVNYHPMDGENCYKVDVAFVSGLEWSSNSYCLVVDRSKPTEAPTVRSKPKLVAKDNSWTKETSQGSPLAAKTTTTVLPATTRYAKKKTGSTLKSPERENGTYGGSANTGAAYTPAKPAQSNYATTNEYGAPLKSMVADAPDTAHRTNATAVILPSQKSDTAAAKNIVLADNSPAEKPAPKVDTVANFSITGYIDAYYAYYTDSVGPGNFQKFPSTSPRNNAPSLNTAQLAVQYTADKIRAMAVFHFGDIASATWAPAPYTNIMEAHFGVKIFSKLWIDAGFFRTHFGTEYLLPAENITSSVAIGTYYEPYYESGIKLNFDPTAKLEINLFLLNGYNVFIDNNNKKSFGLGVTYALNANAGIGYTNYIGDDSPVGDSVAHLRIAHNVFFNYQYHKLKLQVGGDYITQQNSDLATSKKTAAAYSGLATFRYQCTGKLGVYTRGEAFQDKQGYLSGVITDKDGKQGGYQLWGATLGLEFKPTDESYIRLEGRRLQMSENQYIFNYDGQQYNYRYEVMINAGVTFDLLRSVRTK